jgi:hypothetical protein
MNTLPEDFPDLEGALAVCDIAITAAEDYAQARMLRRATALEMAAAAMEVAEAAYPYRQLGAYAAAHAARCAAEAIRAGEHANDNIAMEVVAAAYGANRVALSGGTGQRLDEDSAIKVRSAILADYEMLCKIGGGSFRDLGDPIDPSEDGPLGDLWPDGPPIIL